jgi:transcriptional regulator with XRE-family HTH domain
MGMTKAALAEALGVSRSAVSQALTGNRNMSLNTLADMSRALKLQVRVLVERPNQVSAQARSSTHTTPVLTWSISRPQEPAAVRTEASSGAGLTGAYTITPVGHYAPASAELQ